MAPLQLFLDGDAAQFKQALDGVLDQIVGTGGPGGDADGDLARRQPMGRFDLSLLLQAVMPDEILRDHHGGVLDKKRRQLGFAHFGQVGGVGGIVAADDQQQIHRLAQQLLQGVLAFLGCSADGVKEPEMAVHLRGPEALDDGVFNAALDFLGFAPEHGGLIGHADGGEVAVGVKTRRIGALELLQKLLLASAVADVIADVIGFPQIIYDKIVARPVRGGLGSRGLGFLVFGLAVDDAGDALLGVLTHALPHAHDVAAGGIDQIAALGGQFCPGFDLGAKGRDDDHIACVQLRHFILGRLGGDDVNAHVADLVIDLRVVDDLAQEINRFGWRKDFAGGVSQVDGALDAVAKPEFLGQFDRQQAVGREDMALGADAVDQVAAVMREDLGLDGFHDIGPAQIYFLRRWRRWS